MTSKHAVCILCAGLAALVSATGCNKPTGKNRPTNEHKLTQKESPATRPAPPARPGAEPAPTLLTKCKEDADCPLGLGCGPKSGVCQGKLCQPSASSSGCPEGWRCCFLIPGMYEGPQCLPDCSKKPDGFCGALMHANAVCNKEEGCCLVEKVLNPRPGGAR